MSWRALGLSLSLTLFLPPVLHAANAGKDLEGLKKKIAKEKQGISQVKKKEGSTLQTLEKIEADLETKSKQLNDASARLSTVASEMEEKQNEAASLRSSLAQRQQLFSNRAAALYRWSRAGSPLIVFNGDMSLGSFLRRKHYLEATVAFDQLLVRRLSAETQRRDLLARELAAKKQQLDSRRQALAEAKKLAKIPPDRVVGIVQLPVAPSILERLFSGQLTASASLPPALKGLAPALIAVRAALNGRGILCLAYCPVVPVL